MSLTFGFYNSINHDRKYNAEQMSNIFSQILNDGVFANYGTHFAVSATTGMGIKVNTGRAWFNGTWTFNDSFFYLTVGESEVALSRLDAVVIEVDHNTRINTIKVIPGLPAYSPVGPVLQNGDGVYQHPIAYITIPPQAQSIGDSQIVNVVGSSACPFVTSILQSTDISDLWVQWESYFGRWFEGLQNELDENQAANLQRQINEIRIATGATDPGLGTIGYVGQLYMNTETYALFRCADTNNGTYLWVPVSTRITNGAPTSSTFGFVGEFCMDRNTHYVYKCISSDVTTGTYAWEPMGDDRVGDVRFTSRTDLGPKYAYTSASSIDVNSILVPDFADLATSRGNAILLSESDDKYYMNTAEWECDGYYGSGCIKYTKNSRTYHYTPTIKLFSVPIIPDSSGFNFRLPNSSEIAEITLDTFDVQYGSETEPSFFESSLKLSPVVKFGGLYYLLVQVKANTSNKTTLGRLYSASEITGEWNLVTTGPNTNPVSFDIPGSSINAMRAYLCAIGNYLAIVSTNTDHIGTINNNSSLHLRIFQDINLAPIPIEYSAGLYVGNKLSFVDGIYVYPNGSSISYGSSPFNMQTISLLLPDGVSILSNIFKFGSSYYALGYVYNISTENYDVKFLYARDFIHGPWTISNAVTFEDGYFASYIPYIRPEDIIDGYLYLYVHNSNMSASTQATKVHKLLLNESIITSAVIATNGAFDNDNTFVRPIMLEYNNRKIFFVKAYGTSEGVYYEKLGYGFEADGAIATVPVAGSGARYVRVLK